MKNFKQNKWIFALILIGIFESCQKDMSTVKPIATTNEEQQLKANTLNCKSCLLTHTIDDLFGDPVDFFYNKKGNPDSVSDYGQPINLKYDSKDHLIKINFGNYAYYYFKYDHNNVFPTALYYYYPNFGGLLTIDSFRYNLYGQITSIGSTNVSSPQYNSIEKYTYNPAGNLVKVVAEAHNGGTSITSPVTEFTASKYDNNPNFLSVNPWMKYIFFNSDYTGPYLWLMFSRNNAADFTWEFDPDNIYSVTSTFQYNKQGFANTVTSDWVDSGVDQGIFTRTSSSTCDAATSLGTVPATRSSSFHNKIMKLHSGLPLVMLHK